MGERVITLPALFVSEPHDCPYLKGQDSTSLLFDPKKMLDDSQFSIALKNGFRRSGTLVYRPHCTECIECISIRVDVQGLRLSKSQRRVLKRNQRIRMASVGVEFKPEHFDLYCRYQSWKHRGDSMDHGDEERYEESLLDSSVHTELFEFHDETQLVAVSVVDQIEDGLSAVYTFFDPDHASASLGKLAILRLAEVARTRGLAFLYLGYWIKNCQKMNYKSEFQPAYGFVNGEWQEIRSEN